MEAKPTIAARYFAHQTSVPAHHLMVKDSLFEDRWAGHARTECARLLTETIQPDLERLPHPTPGMDHTIFKMTYRVIIGEDGAEVQEAFRQQAKSHLYPALEDWLHNLLTHIRQLGGHDIAEELNKRVIVSMVAEYMANRVMDAYRESFELKTPTST